MKLWEGGWHRCGTYQMDSDGKVSNVVVKIDNECEQTWRVVVSNEERNKENNGVNAEEIAEK